MKTIKIGGVNVPIMDGYWYLGEGNAAQSEQEAAALKVWTESWFDRD